MNAPAGMPVDLGRRQRRGRGRPGPAVDRRQLAEHVAGGEHVEHDLVALDGVGDLELAAPHDQHVVGLVALEEQDRSGRVATGAAQAHERRALARVEPTQEDAGPGSQRAGWRRSGSTAAAGRGARGQRASASAVDATARSRSAPQRQPARARLRRTARRARSTKSIIDRYGATGDTVSVASAVVGRRVAQAVQQRGGVEERDQVDERAAATAPRRAAPAGPAPPPAGRAGRAAATRCRAA